MTRRLAVIVALALTLGGWPGTSSQLLGPALLEAQHVHGNPPNDDGNGPPGRGPFENGLRTVTAGRQFRPGRDTAKALRLDVTYGSGSLEIAPADGSWLYNVRLENPFANQKSPLIAYDSLSRVLRVTSGSGDHINVNFPRPRHDPETSDLKIGLAKGVPLDIALAFGAGEATAQLGGLSVRRLKIETGASQTTLGFESPNPIPLETLDIEAGAAEFTATGLGNANARHVSVQAGAGSVDLDFSGTWRNDITLDLTAALGAVSIHVPSDVVIDDNYKVYLGGRDDNAKGATPRAGTQAYHLHLTGSTTLGSVEIDRHTAN